MNLGPVSRDSDEVRLSNYLLEAQLLRAKGEVDEASDRFAVAAELGEQIAEAAIAAGDRETGWKHLFSAISCWAQAGNFYAAIHLADDLLDDAGLTPQIRTQVADFVSTIRSRRNQLAAGLASASSGK